ncbi:urease accessory protein [Microbacterium lacticum]|uniref:urease accessory protein UreF n=1 Tax=Microbacterium lacticum TaxID=33885 RepID=UPI0018B04565|nr:urease accessory UreF family protein [Microbacterium lacticum]MBF9334895.1 urease accessory protein [Microbacterium lacticum]
MIPSAHTIALLLADARLPSGGYAFSSGLEPALQGGLAPDEVSAFLQARARTTTMVDAATAVVARAAGIRGAAFAPVERAWAARTPSRATRQASRELGRGLQRLATTLWPGSSPITALQSENESWSRPVVLGVVAAHAGLDPESLVRLAVYDDMACAVAAFLKLEPGDPIDGVRLVIDACASVDTFTTQLAALTSPEAIPAASAPQSEMWAEAHALTNRRLFRA